MEGGWREGGGRVEGGWSGGVLSVIHECGKHFAPKSLMYLGSVAAGKRHSGFLESGYNTYIQPGNSTTVHIHWL